MVVLVLVVVVVVVVCVVLVGCCRWAVRGGAGRGQKAACTASRLEKSAYTCMRGARRCDVCVLALHVCQCVSSLCRVHGV